MRKLAVITGGTKGIGRALVFLFARNDFDVVVCARNSDDLAALKDEVEDALDVDIYTKATDVSKKEEIDALIQFIKAKGRKVDVLINNAGVFIPGQVHSEEEGMLEKMIDTNLYSAYRLTRGLIDGMVKSKSGHIFNMCSTASFMPYVNGGSYCISKYALLGMSKVLREEMKEHNVRVTSVMPGATYTASWEGADIPEERFMKAEDVAEAIWQAYVLSKRTVLEELVLRPQLGDL
ncbi:SDR family NAD(P)-dependent oxidoreductase [Fulvivirga sp. RKSG066]|uniref:SDR family oxidoreductase n=1 Tax=Fulvivirga aurantia TaxID=2529383 RepID=UPI0012BC9494|nr:SDR family NAD(P)-dependent oxidoreductase [Fulvivirga aurantia]MTI22106.1 SDR family NAD(P)-dependent oxidoreductase [Fulvivirga aurantia]